MELSFIHHETHTIIYGIGSLIVTITLIALTRNLFCRKSNDEHLYSKRQRYHSRSFADYSRSTNVSTNKSRSNYELPRPHSNSMKKSKQSVSITNTNTNTTTTNKNDKTTSSLKNSQITNIITNNISNHISTTTHTQHPSPNTNPSSTTSTPNTYTSCPTISSHGSSTISVPNTSTIQLSEGKYGTYLCNVTLTPTSSETPRSISPIPQFTPICESNQTAETLPSFGGGDGKQTPNADTDNDEKYDTDGYDTDNIDAEKESMNHRHGSNGKLPGLSNQASDDPNGRDKGVENSKPRSSISMSVSMSNFKLPRMGSITSRPTSVLKKVLRRMQYGQYDSKDINLSIRITSLCGCIGFLLCLLILCAYYSYDFDAKWKVNLIYLSILFYIISKFIISSCSLCRLYFCLINSSLQYSTCIYMMIITVLIFQFLVSISFCICLYRHWWFMLMYFGVAFYVFDVVYCLVLYVLFTKRMLQLFENTSTYIAKSSARAYHEALRSTQSFDYDEAENISPNLSIKEKKSVEIVTPPSPGNASGFEFGDNCTDKTDHGGIEYAVTHNLSIQIEQIQESQHEHNNDHCTLSQSSLKSPSPRMMIAKSYSTDNIDISNINHKLSTRSRGTSLSMDAKRGNNESLSKRELSRIKRELSKIKRERARNCKKEKWKYYQKQQASGIEYVTRYTVLVLIAALSSLSMAGILVYEQHANFEDFMNDKTMEFHIIFVVDVMINCLSIYFYFIFGKWLYHLSCCLCHSFVQACCVSLCI